LFRRLPKQTRRRIVDYLSKRPAEREGLRLSEEEIQRGRRFIQRRIPDIEPEKAVADLNHILMNQRAHIYRPPPQKGDLIVGHTHVKDGVGPVWNLGCWEKDERHWYLIIDGTGQPKMNPWP